MGASIFDSDEARRVFQEEVKRAMGGTLHSFLVSCGYKATERKRFTLEDLFKLILARKLVVELDPQDYDDVFSAIPPEQVFREDGRAEDHFLCYWAVVVRKKAAA